MTTPTVQVRLADGKIVDAELLTPLSDDADAPAASTDQQMIVVQDDVQQGDVVDHTPLEADTQDKKPAQVRGSKKVPLTDAEATETGEDQVTQETTTNGEGVEQLTVSIDGSLLNDTSVQSNEGNETKTSLATSFKAYSIKERIDLVEIYFATVGAFPGGRKGHIIQMVSDKFKEKHGRPVTRAVIRYNVEKFRQTGSVLNDYSRSGRRPKEHPEIEARVLDEIRKDDTVSIRSLMKMTNSSYHVIRSVLKTNGYKSFKTKYPNTYVLKIPDYHGRTKSKDPRIIDDDKPVEPPIEMEIGS